MSLKKVSLIVVFFVVSMFTIHSVSASQRFADVPSSNAAYEEINYLVDRGVIKGYEENGVTKYKPNNPVTRGQAAKMVIESTNNKPLVVSQSSFTDVKVGTELSGYVESVVKLGFIAEKSKGVFSPNTPLTRNEMAKALSIAFNLNAEKYANLSIPFTDVSVNNSYYKYIAAIYYNGITKGSATGTTFNPTESVTRAQFASFVARASEEKFRLELPVQGVTVPNEAEKIGQVVSTTDGLNVRTSVSVADNSNIIGQINKGDTLPLFEVLNGWYKVSYNGRYAYISATYSKEVGSEPETPEETPEVEEPEIGEPEVEEPVVETPGATNTIGIATVNSLHIRAAANASSKSLGVINRGTEVNVYSTEGKWAKISYKGIEGYTSKKYLRLVNVTGSAVKGRIIVLDPGHGGKDPGASSSGAVEKKIVLEVAKLVQQKLEAAGAIVHMTRVSDTFPTLDDRVKFSESKNAEIFVSIHVNSATNTSAKGTETYYSVSSNDNEKEDYRLASAINSQIVKNADMNDRKVKRADYYVIRNQLIPSVLVELGFVSNAEDRAKLVNSKYVEIFADSIYKGILEYYTK
ncbi:N-acetylmuramoyl-L-alanine amidase [Lysinibacillus endophyticus]|uniref:N-acetylmuramoyl-L-alanine amidase n=1 Tax=Ureibacillus endophyticus TaxID=1978490 RepID=UPI00209D493A|nr:N-acetylmuramoyl-L-alanine amidase [Lysinibacillus endophyticus]MCP1143707.1 N-acetylmuramoyl-L-alanine amidase [Lysinibacillus endophyticus]